MKVNNIKILSTIWFDRFGFIKGKDIATKEIKFYAGIGKGENEKEDIEYIVLMGTKYTEEDFMALTKWFTPTSQDEITLLKRELAKECDEHEEFCLQMKNAIGELLQIVENDELFKLNAIQKCLEKMRKEDKQ